MIHGAVAYLLPMLLHSVVWSEQRILALLDRYVGCCWIFSVRNNLSIPVGGFTSMWKQLSKLYNLERNCWIEETEHPNSATGNSTFCQSQGSGMASDYFHLHSSISHVVKNYFICYFPFIFFSLFIYLAIFFLLDCLFLMFIGILCLLWILILW